MAIILEGNDSSGKSFLADRIGLPVYRSGGPPLDHDHMLRCLSEQHQAVLAGKVLDRITAISQQIYNKPLDVHFKALVKLISIPRTLLIYCRPSDLDYAMSKHQVKAYDTEVHLEYVVKNYHTISERYDEFMQYFPHIKYDWLCEDLNDGKFITLLKKWSATNIDWEEYLVHANWATKHSMHNMLYEKCKYGKILSIFGIDELYVIVQNESYSVIPLSEIQL